MNEKEVKTRMQKILFTGGGSAGHVVPALPLIEDLLDQNWQVFYIGSKFGIEKAIIANYKVKYFSIMTGKLRRYFSLQNFLDPFKIIIGTIQSIFIIFKIKPDVVFSKGGFVGVPVVLGAWINRVPIIAHESDLTPGLANKLSFPFVNKICLTFDVKNKSNKMAFTGTPIRKQIFSGNKQRAIDMCDFKRELPIILFIGGGNGSKALNDLIDICHEDLINQFNIIQIAGKGNVELDKYSAYDHIIFEYVDEELPDLFAYADFIVSRAGSNTIHEIVALQKPHILVPLSAKVSRGDQLLNAKYFQTKFGSKVIFDENLITGFMPLLEEITSNIEKYKQQLSQSSFVDGSTKLLEIINEISK